MCLCVCCGCVCQSKVMMIRPSAFGFLLCPLPRGNHSSPLRDHPSILWPMSMERSTKVMRERGGERERERWPRH